MVPSMEAQCSDREVDSGVGCCCLRIVSYKIISPPDLRGHRTFSVAEVEAKIEV